MVAAVFVTSLVRPDLMPEQLRPQPKIVEVVKTVEVPPEKLPERPNRFTAVLQRDAASPAFILTVDLADRTMTVRRVAADDPVGKSYELWLVSNRFPAPRSLGVVQPGEFTQPPQLASYRRRNHSRCDVRDFARTGGRFADRHAQPARCCGPAS